MRDDLDDTIHAYRVSAAMQPTALIGRRVFAFLTRHTIDVVCAVDLPANSVSHPRSCDEFARCINFGGEYVIGKSTIDFRQVNCRLSLFLILTIIGFCGRSHSLDFWY